MGSGNNLPRVKVSNQAALKRIIYHYGPITRLKVSQMLDLTLPTITTNITTLLKSQIIKEVSASNNGNTMGRRSNLIDINPSSRYFIGIELRRPTRHGCIIDFRGNPIYSEKDETPLLEYDEIVHSGAGVVSSLLEYAKKNNISISEIGVCMAGITDSEKGYLKTQLQYKWFDKPVSNDIATLTGFKGPVIIENDAAARAIKANLFDSLNLIEKRSFAYVFVSNGIACHLLHNASDYVTIPIGPGEIGYMVMEPSFPYNEIGSTGILSEFAGERILKEKCQKIAKEGKAPWLQSFIKEGNELHFRNLLEAQRNGDEGVNEILTEAARYLGIAVANFDNTSRPDIYIVEAKLFENEINRKIFLENARINSFRPKNEELNVIFSTPDEFSGALGAAAVAVQHNLGIYIEGL